MRCSPTATPHRCRRTICPTAIPPPPASCAAPTRSPAHRSRGGGWTSRSRHSPEGKAQSLIRFYLENAQIIRTSLTALGLTVHGGTNAPYAWIQTPKGVSSWQFFDQLLNECHVVGTPGSGFGASGEGYLRLSSFNSRENVNEAMARIKSRLKL